MCNFNFSGMYDLQRYLVNLYLTNFNILLVFTQINIESILDFKFNIRQNLFSFVGLLLAFFPSKFMMVFS